MALLPLFSLVAVAKSANRGVTPIPPRETLQSTVNKLGSSSSWQDLLDIWSEQPLDVAILTFGLPSVLQRGICIGDCRTSFTLPSQGSRTRAAAVQVNIASDIFSKFTENMEKLAPYVHPRLHGYTTNASPSLHKEREAFTETHFVLRKVDQKIQIRHQVDKISFRFFQALWLHSYAPSRSEELAELEDLHQFHDYDFLEMSHSVLESGILSDFERHTLLQVEVVIWAFVEEGSRSLKLSSPTTSSEERSVELLICPEAFKDLVEDLKALKQLSESSLKLAFGDHLVRQDGLLDVQRLYAEGKQKPQLWEQLKQLTRVLKLWLLSPSAREKTLKPSTESTFTSLKAFSMEEVSNLYFSALSGLRFHKVVDFISAQNKIALIDFVEDNFDMVLAEFLMDQGGPVELKSILDSSYRIDTPNLDKSKFTMLGDFQPSAIDFEFSSELVPTALIMPSAVLMRNKGKIAMEMKVQARQIKPFFCR